MANFYQAAKKNGAATGAAINFHTGVGAGPGLVVVEQTWAMCYSMEKPRQASSVWGGRRLVVVQIKLIPAKKQEVSAVIKEQGSARSD